MLTAPAETVPAANTAVSVSAAAVMRRPARFFLLVVFFFIFNIPFKLLLFSVGLLFP